MKSTARPCPHCQQLIRLTDDYLRQYGGRVTACSGCGQQFTLPTVDEVFPADASAAGAIEYASSAPALAAGGDGIWRDGWNAYVDRRATLPELCFRCGSPLDLEPIEFHLEQLRSRRQSHFAATGLVGGLGGVGLPAMADDHMNSRIVVRAYACPRHRSNLTISKALVVTLALTMFIMFAAGVQLLLNQMNVLATLSFIAAVLAGLGAMIIHHGAPTGLVALRVDLRGALISGFGREFLLRLKSLDQARRDYTSQVAQNLGATSDD